MGRTFLYVAIAVAFTATLIVLYMKFKKMTWRDFVKAIKLLFSHDEKDPGWGVEANLNTVTEEKKSVGQKYVDLLLRSATPKPEDFGKYLFEGDGRFGELLLDVQQYGTNEDLLTFQNQLAQYLVPMVDDIMNSNVKDDLYLSCLEEKVFNLAHITNATEEPFLGLQKAVVDRVKPELLKAVGLEYKHICDTSELRARVYPLELGKIRMYKLAGLPEYLSSRTKTVFSPD